VISLIVRLDVALLLMEVIILSFLGKRSMGLIAENACSWLVVRVTRWSLGLFIPVFLMGLIELIFVP
jgi:hypothetical protein